MEVMIMQNTEIELKLLISKDEVEKMLQLDFIEAALRVPCGKRRHLISAYYDTEDFNFTKHGIAYRVRDKGDGNYEATVKTSGKREGALSERKEYNMPVLEFKPKLEGFAALGLGLELNSLAPQGVRLLFVVDVERVTYILDYHGAVIELAVDQGKIVGNNKVDYINEVEMELISGDKKTLLELKERLASKIQIKAEERSKFSRGLALLER